MIVRILSEGQYRLESSYLDRLNSLDNQLVSIVENGSEEEFHSVFNEMLKLVHTNGEAVPMDELVSSDVVLPDPTSHVDEIKRLFKGEGLVPD